MSNDTNNFIVLPTVDDMQISRHHLLPKDIDSSMIIVPTEQQNNSHGCEIKSNLLNKKIGFVGRFNMGLSALNTVGVVPMKKRLDFIESHALFDATKNNTGIFAQGKPDETANTERPHNSIKKKFRMMVHLDDLNSGIALTKFSSVKHTYKNPEPEESDNTIYKSDNLKKKSVHHNSKAHPKNKKSVKKQQQKSRKNNR